MPINDYLNLPDPFHCHLIQVSFFSDIIIAMALGMYYLLGYHTLARFQDGQLAANWNWNLAGVFRATVSIKLALIFYLRHPGVTGLKLL